MTYNEARRWLLLFTLIITACHFLFFLVGPALGFPLEPGEAIRMLEIVVPVFLGYLGAATQFLFRPRRASKHAANHPDLLALLVRGPALLFALISAAALFAFGYANRPGGSGMTPDVLAAMIAGNLGLLTVTTNVIVANLFPTEGAHGQGG